LKEATIPAAGEAVTPAQNDPTKQTPATETPITAQEEQPGESDAEKTGKEGEGEEEQKRKSSRFSFRISQLVNQRRTAESQRDAALAALARLQKPLATDVENLDYDQRERLRHRQALREERVDEVQEQARFHDNVAREAVHEAVIARCESAGDPAVSEALLSIPLTEDTVDFLAESDKAPELVKHLAANPDLAARIHRMTFTGDGRRSPTATRASLREADRMLTAIVAKLGSAPVVRKATNAPNPGTTLNGGSPPPGASLHDLAKSEDATDYIKQRQAQWGKGSR